MPISEETYEREPGNVVGALVDGKVCRCWSRTGGVVVVKEVDIQIPNPQRMTTKIALQHSPHAPTWKEHLLCLPRSSQRGLFVRATLGAYTGRTWKKSSWAGKQ